MPVFVKILYQTNGHRRLPCLDPDAAEARKVRRKLKTGIAPDPIQGFAPLPGG
jgi:hypothetical protein